MGNVWRVVAAVLCAFGLGACGAGSGNASGEPEPVGEVTLSVTTVPPSVTCLQIVAAGSSTVTKQFTVSPGASSVSLAVGQLPLGNVVVTGQAYNVACASIAGQTPSWLADSQTVSIKTGVVSALTVTFRKNNAVNAVANFTGNIVEVADSFSGLTVTYDDGTVRGSGSIPNMLTQESFAQLPGLSNVVQVTLSTYGVFGCALLKNGTVQCWGTNVFGQLGNGTLTSSTTPVAVSGLTGITRIVAGYYHVCALRSDQSVWCWGDGRYGQVGNGTTTGALVPVQAQSGAASITANAFSTCSVTQMGYIACWGDNSFGQLGNGSTTNALSPYYIYTPVLGATNQIALGSYHACALRADGTVRCWGYNGFGELGSGDNSSTLGPVQVVGISNATAIATISASTCALLVNGTVSCWGQGNGIGNGVAVDSNVPVAVTRLPAVSSLFGGANFCTITSNQALYCWGDNGSGQFGGGNNNSAFLPLLITL